MSMNRSNSVGGTVTGTRTARNRKAISSANQAACLEYLSPFCSIGLVEFDLFDDSIGVGVSCLEYLSPFCSIGLLEVDLFDSSIGAGASCIIVPGLEEPDMFETEL